MTRRPGFVGLKLAHPHTCLPFDGPIMGAVVDAVNQSESSSIWVHTGTTPFCPGGLYAA